MKRHIIYSVFLVTFFVGTSCVKDDDYSVPDVSIVDPVIPQEKI